MNLPGRRSEYPEILKKLKEIRVEIQSIRENMPDKDMFLSAEEEKLLEESYENEKGENSESSSE